MKLVSNVSEEFSTKKRQSSVNINITPFYRPAKGKCILTKMSQESRNVKRMRRFLQNICLTLT